MSAAIELLNCLDEIGASVRSEGDRLILRAGNRPVPGDLVKRIREAKPELLAALAPAASEPLEAHRWRERLTARTFEWATGGKRNWLEAERLAWGDLQNEWHAIHGRRWPTWQCAGCEKPMAGAVVLDLPDGNRVHFDPIECLISFGHRWRGEADAALIRFGLERPQLSDNS
jgi:hypothetical protein